MISHFGRLHFDIISNYTPLDPGNVARLGSFLFFWSCSFILFATLYTYTEYSVLSKKLTYQVVSTGDA